MRKALVSLLAFTFVFAAFMGTALAGSAPSAMSFFSSEEYNKTFTDNQGIAHTVKATQVSEVWNKAGSVMFIIQTKETYTDADGNDHAVISDNTKIFTDACPKYPDSTRQTVYRAEWYPDGHSQVAYDYRPVSSPTPAVTQSPTANPTVVPTPKLTVSPTEKATAKPTAEPTACPTPAATPSASYENTAAVTATVASPSPSPSTELTSSPSPMIAAVITASNSPKASDAAIPAAATQHSEDNVNTTNMMTLLVVAGATLFVLIVCLIILILRRRRKVKRKNGPDQT